MKYFVFKDQIFTVFLSLSHLTSITFPSKVLDFVGGDRGDFKVYELNKGRSLVYEPHKSSVDKNFLVFLKDQKFHYNLKSDNSFSDKDIEIKKAKPCKLFSLLKETKNFKLFECPRSLYLVNKSPRLKVNEMEIGKAKFLSKGPPLWVDGDLIYYRGELR